MGPPCCRVELGALVHAGPVSPGPQGRGFQGGTSSRLAKCRARWGQRSEGLQRGPAGLLLVCQPGPRPLWPVSICQSVLVTGSGGQRGLLVLKSRSAVSVQASLSFLLGAAGRRVFRRV